MKKLLIITLLFFCIIGYVSGGENTTIYDDAPMILNDEPSKTIVALEDGHLNTSFSNNYNGYCVEYTEQEAKKDDKFYVKNTTHIRNNKTNDDVSQYLKRYFIDYYNETQKDKITTQHTIWHFTDNFNGWRLNYTLINNIKNSNNNYDDNGTVKWNTTHNMKYSFIALISPYEHHQNYFAYKIIFEEKPKIENNNNTENITNNTTNITQNKKPLKNNTTIIKENKTKQKTKNTPQNKINKHINTNIKTANPITVLLLSIIFTIIMTFSLREK